MEDGSSSPLWACIIFIVFIIINGIVYGFGAAIQKVSENDMEKKAEEGDEKSIYLLKMLNNPSVLVNTIQVIATLLSIMAGYFGCRAFPHYIVSFLMKHGIQDYIGQPILEGASIILVMLCSVILLLSIGVISAKKIFSYDAQTSVYRYVGIIKVLIIIFTPLTFLITHFANLIVRICGIDPCYSSDDVTEEEIISMVDEAHEQGVIEEREAEMIQNIIEFSDKDAKDIMTHRKNIVAINEDNTLDEAIAIMLQENNSRYPVYREDIDNIQGVIYLKDAMKQLTYHHLGNIAVREISNLVRPASFIPETKNINEIFKRMQLKKVHMAIVIDEYGQTSGLVAMEDILEEIVGDILDEYDEDDNFIQAQHDDSLIMNGLTPLEQVGEVLHVDFEEEQEQFETLNGYLTSLLGHIPNVEEDREVHGKGYLFKILSVENNTIEKVRVEKLFKEEEGEKSCQDIRNSQI